MSKSDFTKMGQKYARILHSAWELTLQYPRLKWFVFVPSFAGVIMFAIKIGWQLAMLLDKKEVIDFWASVKDIFIFFIEEGLVPLLAIGVVIVLLMVYVLWAWVEATVMSVIKKLCHNPEGKISLRQNMMEATHYFFRIFELHAVLGPFSLVSILLFTASAYRYLTPEMFQFLVPFMVVFGIISIAINIFMSFAPYYIIHEDAKLMESLKKSAALVFMQFGSTLVIAFLIFLVNIRIIINTFLAIGVPALLIWGFAYFTNIFVIGVIILIGLILLGLAAYLSSIVEVFTTGVWTDTFIRFRKDENRLISGNHEVDIEEISERFASLVNTRIS